MNRRTIIILSCVVYVAAMTSMFHFVEKYIEYKNNKLYQEITDFFYEVFEGEEYGGTYGSKKASQENILAVIDPVAHGLDMLYSEGSADCASPVK